MRRAARVDRNQAALVAALRAVGASVTPTHFVGRGFPDLVVGLGGANFLLEVKTPVGELTQDEADFIARWRGQIAVVRTIDEALAVLGLEAE